ncbi:MAG: alpha/beta fold hydrolase [Dehalococcoidia bacterium]
MLSVTAALPDQPSAKPAIVLVHGAASSALVWTHWQTLLAECGWPSYAIDLRGHGRSTPVDLSSVSMYHYADDVRSLLLQLSRPVVMGWSMGGLVAIIAAANGDARPPEAVVALAPSTPARQRNPAKELRPGVYGPEYYGITSRDPTDQPAMPDLDRDEREIAIASLGQESAFARADRAAGIVIESLPCPLMIVTGSDDPLWPRSRFDGLWLDATYLDIEGPSHWGLVLSHRALATAVPAVVEWLDQIS